MIACGKKEEAREEVEVIPPYKIVVVRTCILKFLHSDPPVDPTMPKFNVPSVHGQLSKINLFLFMNDGFITYPQFFISIFSSKDSLKFIIIRSFST
jgi:hypothetical protein